MGPLILFLTTFIWGTAFLAQKLVGEQLGPVAITVFRNVLGGAFLLIVFACRRQRSPQPLGRSVVYGIACGVPLFAAMLTQQVGIQYTTPGICAFLTTNYVLFVPLMAAVLARQLPTRTVMVAALLALTGTYFICVGGAEFGIGRGELWTLGCAMLFSVQMLVVDRVTRRGDVLVISMMQLFTCMALGLPLLLLPSEWSRLAATPVATLRAAIWPIVYLGVFSSGIAYTLQNVGQSRTPPGVAAIILSMESVFGALAGWLVLGDLLSSGQLLGCALVFVATLLPQITGGSK